MSGSPRIPRTLGLTDLVLLGTVAIVNVNTVPPVAGFGRATLLLWVVAFAAFFIPEAIAVMALSRRYPGEGGVYLWARRHFGDLHGFVSGWCYWTNNLFYVPVLLVYLAGVVAFAGGASTAGLVDDKWFVATIVATSAPPMMITRNARIKRPRAGSAAKNAPRPTRLIGRGRCRATTTRIRVSRATMSSS